ncbi:hypothetical protein ACFL35_06705, partial [Candidatus Riflebacteria bacterium]
MLLFLIPVQAYPNEINTRCTITIRMPDFIKELKISLNKNKKRYRINLPHPLIREMALAIMKKHYLWNLGKCKEKRAKAGFTTGKHCPKGGRYKKGKKGISCTYHHRSKWKIIRKNISQFSITKIVNSCISFFMKPWFKIFLLQIDLMISRKNDGNLTLFDNSSIFANGNFQIKHLKWYLPRLLSMQNIRKFSLFDDFYLKEIEPDKISLTKGIKRIPELKIESDKNFLVLNIPGKIFADSYRSIVKKTLQKHCMHVIQKKLKINIKRYNRKRTNKFLPKLDKLVIY